MSLAIVPLIFLVASVSAEESETCSTPASTIEYKTCNSPLATLEEFKLTGCKGCDKECVVHVGDKLNAYIRFTTKERGVNKAHVKIAASDTQGEVIHEIILRKIDDPRKDFGITYPLKAQQRYEIDYDFILEQCMHYWWDVFVKVELVDNETLQNVFCFEFKASVIE